MSSPRDPIYRLSLFDHGKTLAELLAKLKSDDQKADVHPINNSNSNSNSNNNDQRSDEVRELEVVIEKMVKELKDAQKSLAQDSRDNIIRKMEEKLQQFIKVDPANTTSYQQLVKKFKSETKSHQRLALPSLAGIHSCSQYKTTTTSPLSRFEDFSFEEKYEYFTEADHQKCLLCFTVFPDGAEINKRELINWWIGVQLITTESSDDNEDKTKGQRILHKLVKNGFLTRINNNNHTYRICDGAHSKLKSKAGSNNFWHEKARVLRREQNNSDDTKGAKPKDVLLPEQDESVRRGHSEKKTSYYTNNMTQKDQGLESIEAFLNIDENNLGNHVSGMLSKMKTVKVVHLGKWQYDKNYVIVEDIEELSKALKNLEHVCFLSLRGISGVVKLPDTIYRIKNLKVLDLRACHNLESMPDGIELLSELTDLDLSECYLLDCVPKGIASLTKLRVLKGFVIPPYQEPEGGGSERNAGKKASCNKSCAFRDLSKLKELRKLCIRTRRMDFPKNEDVNTLCKMKQLNILRIAWVKSSRHTIPWDNLKESTLAALTELEKLELQAAPEAAWQLLELISRSCTGLKKLYIRGGELKQLGEIDPLTQVSEIKFSEIKKVRLRYLHKLDVNWVHFKNSFPKLGRLEIYGCPNLIDFPYDNNGVWERSECMGPPSWVSLGMY